MQVWRPVKVSPTNSKYYKTIYLKYNFLKFCLGMYCKYRLHFNFLTFQFKHFIIYYIKCCTYVLKRTLYRLLLSVLKVCNSKFYV